MKYQQQRTEGTPCANTACRYYNEKFEQSCAASCESGRGPYLPYCINYYPLKTVEQIKKDIVDTVEAMQAHIKGTPQC